MRGLDDLIKDLRLEHARGREVCKLAADKIEEMEAIIDNYLVAIRSAMNSLSVVAHLADVAEDPAGYSKYIKAMDIDIHNINIDIRANALDGHRDLRQALMETPCQTI
jgi:hypothetical protein